MNVKILKKIGKKVKFETTHDNSGKDLFNVYQLDREGVWHCVLSSHRKAKALQRKHNEWLHAIGRIGKTPWLLERRKKRGPSKKKELVAYFKEKDK
jgi:hypothetical protein